MRKLYVIPLLMSCLVCGGVAAESIAQETATQDQLARWLKQYPQADANHDGVLSVDEAKDYRRRLMAQRTQPIDYGFRTEFTFATMSDGIKIALAVGYPRDYDPKDTDRKWPAMFEMMGYPDSTMPKPPRSFGDRYVTVRASVRGAGASGGTIRAISLRTGMDGHEIIENWIVKQPWSNGKVALHGHSWGGLTGFMIAATAPPHLSAVAVSGLFDDVYRDIGRMGGVRNAGFPVDWTVNLYKPTGPFDSGEAAVRARGMSRTAYEEIVAARPELDLKSSILWRSLNGYEYEALFSQASPGRFAAGVRAPIHIMHAYQDEQTGPSGAWLWPAIPDDVPKRLVLSNGDHGDVGQFNRERMTWLDFWTLQDGKDDPADFLDRDRRVQVYFETPRGDGPLHKPLVAADFPLPGTEWTRVFLHDNRRLSTEVPEVGQDGDSYRVRVGASDQADGCYYLLKFDQPTAICGPITASLWIQCTTVDTDLFVMLADVDADETVQMLQRGMLRASHRAVDDQLSSWASVDGQRTLIRPRHTHRDCQPLMPGEPYRLDIEIFPVGHVFREGHRLGLWISQPPLGDPVTRNGAEEPTYKYESAMPPAKVTILHDREHASSVLLPILPALPSIGTTPPRPGRQAGIFVK